MSSNSVSLLAVIIKEWALTLPTLRALFWYGGYGYGRIMPTSDLDAVLLLCDTPELVPITESLVTRLNDRDVHVAFHIADQETRRISIWTGKRLCKIDLILASQPSELLWLAEADDVPAPRFTSAFPVNDLEVEALLAKANTPIDEKGLGRRRERAELEIDKFLVAFEACSSAHANSDGYGFYFQYNLALGRLVRIIQLTRAGYSHLYLPRNLLSRHLTLDEQKLMRSLAGTLYLPEALDRKKGLAEAFLSAVDEAVAVLGVRTALSSLDEFLAAIQVRDLFFNERDVSLYFDGLLVPCVLYRSSALSRWTGRPELVQWIRERHVSDIIDFRTQAEIDKLPYDSATLDRVQYHHLPISETVNDVNHAYFSQLMAHPAMLTAALTVLAESEEATVVHCHAGKDRTGWFCAFLQMLLDMPRAAIINDYLASRSNTQETLITAFLDDVNSQGGAESMALRLSCTSNCLRKLKARLLLASEASHG